MPLYDLFEGSSLNSRFPITIGWSPAPRTSVHDRSNHSDPRPSSPNLPSPGSSNQYTPLPRPIAQNMFNDCLDLRPDRYIAGVRELDRHRHAKPILQA